MDEGLKQIKTPEEIKEQEFKKVILTWKDLDVQKFERESKGCPERTDIPFMVTNNEIYSGTCRRKSFSMPCKKENCPFWYWRNQP